MTPSAGPVGTLARFLLGVLTMLLASRSRRQGR
jgi:hypothetical protein